LRVRGTLCSVTLIVAKLGLLARVPACTDLTTKPWVQEPGVEVLNQPFSAQGNVATAGGGLASPYLAAWIIARLQGIEAAAAALHCVAPVGENDEFVARAAARHALPAALKQRASASASSHTRCTTGADR
jgi:transcriptional regulator GlxA family with amidase domain